MPHSWKNYSKYRLEEQIDSSIHIYIFTAVVKVWYMKKIMCVFWMILPSGVGKMNEFIQHMPLPITANSPPYLFFVSSVNQVTVTIKRSRDSFEVLLKRLRGKTI